jgi:hypothetical protein
MAPNLSLVRGEARAVSSFRPPHYRLGERAQRPGELADLLVVALDDHARGKAEKLARAAALPLPLMVVIAVESERALREAAEAGGFDVAELAAALDAVAAEAVILGFDPPAARRLRAYAAAVRSGGYDGSPSARSELVIAHHVLARWSLVAQATGLTLDAWLSELLGAAETGRERWEAAAADEGQMLAEWIALHALSLARRSSSAAQATASG